VNWQVSAESGFEGNAASFSHIAEARCGAHEHPTLRVAWDGAPGRIMAAWLFCSDFTGGRRRMDLCAQLLVVPVLRSQFAVPVRSGSPDLCQIVLVSVAVEDETAVALKKASLFRTNHPHNCACRLGVADRQEILRQPLDLVGACRQMLVVCRKGKWDVDGETGLSGGVGRRAKQASGERKAEEQVVEYCGVACVRCEKHGSVLQF
jgi:hypothetical protein